MSNLNLNIEVVDALWIAQGPAPINNGSVTIVPDDQVIGAINTALAHPDNADILYIGAVNGGIWRTTNATDPNPDWESLTDEQQGYSITMMEFDPTDSTNQTFIAGVGRSSSFGNRGGPLTGLLLTTDGGNSFTQITGNPNRDQDDSLIGRNISGVAKRGNLILATADSRDQGIGAGVYRSTDNGTTWNFISGVNGLSFGVAFDLVGDPTDLNRFYVSVQGVGIFRTDNGGNNWTNISANDTAINGINAAITGGTNTLTEMSVASNGRLYAAVLRDDPSSNIDDILQYVGYSDDQGATWQAMDIPPVIGRGAFNHFSIQADPNDSTILYIAGVEQPFRGDTTAASGMQWVSIWGAGNTANGTSPHVDSRDIIFDANGDLIQVDDGGIYRRTNPQDINNLGDWFSVNGDLQVTEFHDIAYDTVSNIIIGGSQDNGTPEEIATDSFTWNDITGGDGGDVAVSVDPNDPSQSVRYASSQFLINFRRRVYDNNNGLISDTIVPLNGFDFDTDGSGPDRGDEQFVTPVVVNAVNPTRLVIGGRTRVYESFDQGDNVTVVNTTSGGSVGVNSSDGDPIAYGANDNEDILYIGSGATVQVRTTGSGTLANTGYTGGTVRDLVLDFDNSATAFAIDDDQVFQTLDMGTNWTDITGDLSGFLDFTPAGGDYLRSLEYISGPVFDAVVVGSTQGVFAARSNDWDDWFAVGPESLPNAPVWDMDADETDDVLVVGTLGRGAWQLSNIEDVLGLDGDIVFNIFKDVDLNKTVNLEINKTVEVNVDNPDQLATAEADAEAFGPFALAEVDAYTLVTPNEAFAYTESTAALDLKTPADTFTEIGDAGELIGEDQGPVIIPGINTIEGSLFDTGDIDLYQLQLSFDADVTIASSGEDLFLFDQIGRGLETALNELSFSGLEGEIFYLGVNGTVALNEIGGTILDPSTPSFVGPGTLTSWEDPGIVPPVVVPYQVSLTATPTTI